MALGTRFLSVAAIFSLSLSGIGATAFADEQTEPAAESSAVQTPAESLAPAASKTAQQPNNSQNNPANQNPKPTTKTTKAESQEKAGFASGSADVKPVDGWGKVTLEDAASITTDKAVIDSLNEIREIQATALRLNQNLERSKKEQEEAEKQLADSDSQLADQQKRVDETSSTISMMAMAQQQHHQTAAAAGVIFRSEETSEFLSDIATMRNAADISYEQLRRALSERDRLNDLKTVKKQLADQAANEVAKQEALKQQYDAKVKQAEEVLLKLSPEQRELLAKLNDSLIKDRSAMLFDGGSVDLSGISGLPTGRGQGVWPASGPTTSPFGYRINPIGGYSELHDGTDIGAPCGAPIKAAWTGVVVSARYENGWGNRVVVDSGKYKAAYNHMSGIAVQAGQTINAGHLVGAVGTTGWSTGCHLHFSTWENGQIIDPMTLF